MRAIAHIIRRLSILAALLVASTSAAAAPEQDPDAIAERADRALASLQTLEAHFVQRVANPVLEKTEIGHGVLYYRAPGRYRIEYTYPRGDVVVDDGTWVWIYLPSSQPGQVIRQPGGRDLGFQDILLRDCSNRVLDPGGSDGLPSQLDLLLVKSEFVVVAK